jgi:acetyl esterase
VGEIFKPDVDIDDRTIPGGRSGGVSVRIMRPKGVSGQLPVILYTLGAGWVFGNVHTHDRLIRELVAGTDATLVFTNYSLSPEARYRTAIEEIYAVLEWTTQLGAEHGLDGSRIAAAGNSVGGNMTAAITQMTRRRSGPMLAEQVLFYPVTDGHRALACLS